MAAMSSDNDSAKQSPDLGQLGGKTGSPGNLDPDDQNEIKTNNNSSQSNIQNNNSQINSVDDVFNKPELVEGKTPSDIQNVVDNATSSGNWQQGVLGRGSRAGQGFTLREVNAQGNYTGRMIQWHPGGGHHGIDPYWKISSPQGGTIRIGPQFPIP